MYRIKHRPINTPPSLHYHQWPELGLCLSGRGIFYIHNNVYPFEAGCVSIIYPGECHIAQSVSENLSEWWFVTIDDKALFTDWPDGEHLWQMAQNGNGRILTHTESRQIKPALQRMIELYTEDHQVMLKRRTWLGALFAGILYETSEWPADPTEQKLQSCSGINSIVYPAIQYMLTNYMNPIDTSTLCAICHISPVHLRRLFTSSLGISPIAFLHRLRISHACLELTGTGESILRIAEHCGYTSLNSFNHQFRKQMHLPPSKYRQKAGMHAKNMDL